MSQGVSAVSKLADQMWRLHNLYYIINKDGKKIPFKPNWAQTKVFENMQVRTIIPKGRQMGISTGIGILQLDCALFEPGFSSMTIAHDLEAAEKLFYRNIKLPYDNLPESITNMVGCYRDRARELRFTNESMVTVGTSGRSGAYQIMHVSEFGKICAKYPERAREIVTGAFEAAGKEQMILVESTAEGAHGYFHDYCMEAFRAELEGAERGPLDWKLIFLEWWKHPDYVLPPSTKSITPELKKYFQNLEHEHGIKLGPARRTWYAAKAKALDDDVRREYPAYLKEAFEQSIKGAYYETQMTKMREQGRICSVPHQTGVRVETWWDLGIDDAMAIWFVQEVGRELHVINYFEDSGEGLPHYAQKLGELAREFDYVYGEHVAPHDIAVRELGSGKTRIETAADLGIQFTRTPRVEVADGIEAMRNELGRMWIDKQKCGKLIASLDAYQKEWDDARGCYKQKPLHNWASHGADAGRTGVVGRRYTVRVPAQAVKVGSAWAV